MKKLILGLILMLCCLSNINAETWTFRTTQYAYASVYNGRYVWGDWESSDMLLTINLTTDVVTIYSPRKQIYYVYATYNNGNWYYDSNGGKTIKYYIVDQDRDKGEMRLRIESNGNSQIYIDFNDCAWCYNVVRIN